MTLQNAMFLHSKCITHGVNHQQSASIHKENTNAIWVRWYHSLMSSQVLSNAYRCSNNERPAVRKSPVMRALPNACGTRRLSTEGGAHSVCEQSDTHCHQCRILHQHFRIPDSLRESKSKFTTSCPVDSWVEPVMPMTGWTPDIRCCERRTALPRGGSSRNRSGIRNTKAMEFKTAAHESESVVVNLCTRHITEIVSWLYIVPPTTRRRHWKAMRLRCSMATSIQRRSPTWRRTDRVGSALTAIIGIFIGTLTAISASSATRWRQYRHRGCQSRRQALHLWWRADERSRRRGEEFLPSEMRHSWPKNWNTNENYKYMMFCYKNVDSVEKTIVSSTSPPISMKVRRKKLAGISFAAWYVVHEKFLVNCLRFRM